MASWRELAEAEPEFADRVRAFLDAGVHKTIATLRHDGSPRISGTEARFANDHLWFGAMWRSRKALDLQRDPRFALHSASVDPPGWKGDAKINGRAEELEDDAQKSAFLADGGGQAPDGPWHLFVARIDEAVVVQPSEAGDHLVIELWREGEGVRRMERK